MEACRSRATACCHGGFKLWQCPRYNLDTREQRLALLCMIAYLLFAAFWFWHQHELVKYSSEHPAVSYREASFMDELVPDFNITIIPLTNFNRSKYNCHMGRSQFQIYFVGGNRSVYIDTDQGPIGHLKWQDFGGDARQTGLYYTVLPLPFRFAFRRNSAGAVEAYQILKEWWLEGLKCLDGKTYQPTECPRESSRVDFYYTFHQNNADDSGHCVQDIHDLFVTSDDVSQVLNERAPAMTSDLAASPGSIVPILVRSFKGGVFIPANPAPDRPSCRNILPVTTVETDWLGKLTSEADFRNSMHASVQGLTLDFMEGFCGMTILPVTKRTVSYYVQYRPIDAMTHWFTVMHACLAVIFCLFKSSPQVPYYYRRGRWADSYRKLLEAGAHDLQLRDAEDPRGSPGGLELLEAPS
ncbi:GIP [Symbiodinium natans]|uniref:GIP protein n=1 Tax=Symbiodinium natans TaxID=878477 RepID=A0A812NEM8_9DINO|nr:GIP [Symbiodinium natans]